MEFQALRGFIAVSKTGSIIEAARQVHLSPSAVSLQIKKLEDEFGAQLFNRTHKKMTLTGKGRCLLEIMSPVVDKLNLAKALMSEEVGSLSGSIVIVSVYDIMQYYRDSIAHFVSTYPKISLTCLTRRSPEILSLLASGDADFGFARVDPPKHTFGSSHVITTRPTLIAPRNHPLSRKSRVSFSDLCESQFIFLQKGATSRQLIEAKFSEQGCILRVSFETWSCNDIIDYVSRGLGPGIIHDICVPKDRRALRVVDLAPIFGVTNVNLIYRKRKYLSRADRLFMGTFLGESHVPAESGFY